MQRRGIGIWPISDRSPASESKLRCLKKSNGKCGEPLVATESATPERHLCTCGWQAASWATIGFCRGLTVANLGFSLSFCDAFCCRLFSRSLIMYTGITLVFFLLLLFVCSSFFQRRAPPVGLADWANAAAWLSFTYWLQVCLLSRTDHGKKGFVILTKLFVKIWITKTFCYNNKMFSSVNKAFGCCSKIFGCSNKNFICCP